MGKRILALMIVCTLVLCGCSKSDIVAGNEATKIAVDQSKSVSDETKSELQISKIETESNETNEARWINEDEKETDTTIEASPGVTELSEITPDFSELDAPELLRYVQDKVYDSVVENLDSDKYYVQDVSVQYISKEYIEELEYNSQENIFFGYSLSDLDSQFSGTRYVFTLSDEGDTEVRAFEAYDDTYEQVIKNVAIGAGVILVCVVVAAVTDGAGVPAVAAVFAASAKTAAIMAVSSGLIGGVASGIVTGVETQSYDQAIKAAALAGSEGFKWGAITGVVTGGTTEALALKGATLNGLTMNQAAQIQKESKYPLDVIREFKTMEQYEICKEAGLTPQMVNGKMSLVRNIDINYVDEFGRTNLERMGEGLAAIDPKSGLSYELHHIGQRPDSTLAILTKGEHMQGGNNAIWHEFGEASKIDRTAFGIQRAEFWQELFELMGGIE